jgi:hypothetical protein
MLTTLLRILVVGVALALWFKSQRWLGNRKFSGEGIQDKIHEWTAPVHHHLVQNHNAANRLLVASSLGIDLLGIYLLGAGLFGSTITPIVGLLFLFTLRQLSQYLTALPPPPGMIWRDPGVPSLLVTYGVSNDLFFSGHTAIAVFGALQLFHTGDPLLMALGVFVAFFEMGAVLVLRAHWTMDVYAGVVTAVLADSFARQVGPLIDQGLRL